MAKTELLSGTLDLLVLRVLHGGARHGFAMAERIHVLSREVLSVEEGSLYPALYRREEKGRIEPEWGQSENNRRARVYKLTPGGRRRLAQETASWEQFALSMKRILQTG